MTHFVGLVVAETEAELTDILQPFHEYECTGIDDQYVLDIDRTEEALAEFAKATVVRLRDAAGVLHDRFTTQGAWKPEFSKLAEFGQRKEFVPPGYERVEVPASSVETAADWIRGYYGWPIMASDTATSGDRIEVDASGAVTKCVVRTNPNKQWDWWVVGGRWKNIVPGNSCLVEAVANWFPDWQPSVLVDAEGWHSEKEWGWFGMSAPSDTPEIMAAKMAEHAGKRVWVVDFHI